MMKRIRWIMIGAAIGVAGYLWAKRRAGEAKQVLPEHSREAVAVVRQRAHEIGERLRDALAEGREAMHERELELRTELGAGDGHRA